MDKLVLNLPNAEILIDSMRSIGYDFETAIADIVDNSITANASNIDVLYPIHDTKELYILIIDDGNGMNRNELIEAMKFGTKKKERLREDLGRFGLGLKTASISQAKKFTVTSKKDNEINSFTWDLDEIKKHMDWQMIENSIDDLSVYEYFSSLRNLKSFTVVHWEKIDKLENELNAYKNIQDVFLEKLTLSENHIALTFHRFIEKGLSIRFNNKYITAYDPFLSKHTKTIIKQEEFLTTKTSSGLNEKVAIQVFVLPYHKDLDKKDIEIIGGIDNLDKQGFYVYRNKRLMIYGTWFRLKPRNELSNNARIRVDIPNSLDDLWSIDVKKQRAKIPASLLEQLKGEVSQAVEKAKKIHVYKGNVQVKGESIWSKVVDKKENKVTYSINRNSLFIKNSIDKFDDNQIKHINRIIDIIEMTIPYKDIYNSVADKKEINESENNDELIKFAINYYNEIKSKRKLNKEQIINLICEHEPFLSANIKNKLMEVIHEN